MTTYLLTWNPRGWHWKDYDEARAQTAAGTPYTIDWRCAHRAIRFGDRVFLHRQGQDGRGIFAAGHATGLPYERPIPDNPHKTAWYVPVSFELVLHPEIDPVIGEDRLNQPDLRTANWSTRQSGILLSDGIAAILEHLWAEATG